MISTIWRVKESCCALVDLLFYKFNFIYAVDLFSFFISGSGLITDGSREHYKKVSYSLSQTKLKSDTILELQKIPCC